MSKPLRFTGEDPPFDLWPQYPNWRNAIEEEGEEGQDETTLMPDEIQSHIGEYTSFTAGEVRFNDGHIYPALLEVLQRKLKGCNVFEKDTPWRIHHSTREKRWLSFRAEWLPEDRRPPSVSFENEAIFPLEIRMQVPWIKGEAPARYQIAPDGQIRPIQ